MPFSHRCVIYCPSGPPYIPKIIARFAPMSFRKSENRARASSKLIADALQSVSFVSVSDSLYSMFTCTRAPFCYLRAHVRRRVRRALNSGDTFGALSPPVGIARATRRRFAFADTAPPDKGKCERGIDRSGPGKCFPFRLVLKRYELAARASKAIALPCEMILRARRRGAGARRLAGGKLLHADGSFF